MAEQPDRPIDEVLAAVRARWKEEGITPGTPATQAEMEAFEAQHGVRLPDDVRAWFLTLNGVELGRDGAMDGLWVTFWNLSQVRPVPSEVPELRFPGADRHLVFADYLLWCDAYALRLPDEPGGPTPVVVLFAKAGKPLEVAPSLTAFLQAWLDADAGVLSPVVPQPPEPARSPLRGLMRRWFPEPSDETRPELRNRRAVGRALTRFAKEQALRPDLRRGGDRVAVLRMRIDRGGVPDPEAITLDQSTGDRTLDAEALRLAGTMRFRPARIGGNPVNVWVTIPITYTFR